MILNTAFQSHKKSGAGITGATFTQKRSDDELFRAHFRTPFIEPSFITIDEIGQCHTADREDQNTDKYFISLESGAGNRNHKTDARCSRIQFTDHNTDQGAADGKTQTGQYKWNRRGKDDRLEDLPFRSAETARRSEKVRGRGFDAIAGIDQKREDGAKKNDSDFRQDADTEPDDNQGK